MKFAGNIQNKALFLSIDALFQNEVAKTKKN